MKQLLFSFFIIFLSSFLCSHSPLVLCLILVLISITTGLISLLLMNPWVMYSIILIFTGGMMVMMIYVTALSTPKKVLTYPLSPMIMASTIVCTFFPFKPNISNWPMDAFFSSKTLFLVWGLLMYLLLVMFLIMKCSESFKGALLKFNY